MAKTTWTDPTITAGTTKITTTHVQELRNAVNRYRKFYGLVATSFTDPTLSAQSTMDKIHIDELRSQINYLHKTAFTWTDATITAGTTMIKKTHMDELRANMNHIETNHCWQCDSCDSESCGSCDADSGCGTDQHFDCSICDYDKSCSCNTQLCAGDDYECPANILECSTCVNYTGCYRDGTWICDCDINEGCGCDGHACAACDISYNRV